MPSLISHFVFTLIVLLFLPLSVSAEHPQEWLTDFAKAHSLAAKSDRPILLHFHATWCPPCRIMERDVLHTSQVKRLLGEEIIGVKIDSDDYPELISRYGIGSLPSDVMISPNGNVLKRSSGYQDKSSYSTMIARASAMYQPRVPAQAIAKSDQDNTMLGNKPAEPSLVQPILGLGGYSPIVLLEERRWELGNDEFSFNYQGIIYHMRSNEELARFKSDPSRFAPRLLECDPVELWKSDQAVRGSTQYGAYFDGQLYLFTNFENRETFKKTPLRYVETQHVLRVSDIVLR